MLKGDNAHWCKTPKFSFQQKSAMSLEVWISLDINNIRFICYVMSHSYSGHLWRPLPLPCAVNNIEEADMTRRSADSMGRLFLHPLALSLSRGMEILPAKRKRLFWGPKCMSRCLRSGSLHPAQCHMFCA